MREKHYPQDKEYDKYGNKNISIPEGLYERLEEISWNLSFQHRGKASVRLLLDAISEIDIEKLEDFLGEHGLLPKRKMTDRLWD